MLVALACVGMFLPQATVSAGEQSGALEDAMQRAIDLMDNSIKLSGKIKGALAYPGFLMFMTVTMTIGIADVAGFFAN